MSNPETVPKRSNPKQAESCPHADPVFPFSILLPGPGNCLSHIMSFLETCRLLFNKPWSHAAKSQTNSGVPLNIQKRVTTWYYSSSSTAQFCCAKSPNWVAQKLQQFRRAVKQSEPSTSMWGTGTAAATTPARSYTQDKQNADLNTLLQTSSAVLFFWILFLHEVPHAT